jgi:hypothetical protein
MEGDWGFDGLSGRPPPCLFSNDGDR